VETGLVHQAAQPAQGRIRLLFTRSGGLLIAILTRIGEPQLAARGSSTNVSQHRYVPIVLHPPCTPHLPHLTRAARSLIRSGVVLV